jgi:Transposase DDE domain group 1
VALVRLCLQERARLGPPHHILLDLDGKDDPVQAEQEGTFYHGYFGQHMYHPLLIFDGDTNQLITAVLRPGGTEETDHSAQEGGGLSTDATGQQHAEVLLGA